MCARVIGSIPTEGLAGVPKAILMCQVWNDLVFAGKGLQYSVADAMVDATREGGGAEVTAVLSLTQQATPPCHRQQSHGGFQMICIGKKAAV